MSKKQQQVSEMGQAEAQLATPPPLSLRPHASPVQTEARSLTQQRHFYEFRAAHVGLALGAQALSLI